MQSCHIFSDAVTALRFQFVERKGFEEHMSQVGKFLAGHSLFIAGQPKSYTPLLARHFFFVESLLLPACAALAASHYCSSMAMYPERKAQMQFALGEVNARADAMVFWSKQLSTNRNEPITVATRGFAVVLQTLSMPVWLLVAAWSPSQVHQCLATAVDILQQKYVGTAQGAPHEFYTPQIDRMTPAKNQHRTQGDVLTTDYAAAILITFFVLIHFR